MSVAVETARSSALWDKFTAESSDWFSTRFEFHLLGPVAFAPQFEFYPDPRLTATTWRPRTIGINGTFRF